MEDRHPQRRAPHTPQVPVPPVPNRAETEMRAPGQKEIEFPRGTEIDLPGKVRPEMQVGNFKPHGVGAHRENSLGNFESNTHIPENGIEN